MPGLDVLAKSFQSIGPTWADRLLWVKHILKKNNTNRILYTDSKIAMSWVKKKMCNTKLERNTKNKPVFDLIDRALDWLKNNTYSTVIVKWETKAWGEIPADFGRK